jgi:NTE family protein
MPGRRHPPTPGGEGASLESRAAGLPSATLITPCGEPGPTVDEPDLSEPAFALAFSGGGFRASLAAVGVLRFAADAGILGRVRYVSSVSGGSITHGLFAAAYEELERGAFAPAAVDKLVVHPLIREISDSSFQLRIVRNLWRGALGETRTDVLADMLDRRFFRKVELGGLPTTCRFVFNASNLSTGVRFTFEPQRVGDYVIGYAQTTARKGSALRLADAVAASAAFPGAFSPFFLGGYNFPCSRDGDQPLVDGGSYDNLGLEAVGNLLPPTCLVALNAGGLFHTGFAGGIPLVGDLKRVNALLYRQSTSLRSRIIVERFRAYDNAVAAGDPIPEFARRGVFFSLATTMTPTAEWGTGRPDADATQLERLATLKTSFAKFSPEDCKDLVYRGWWLAGATLSRFHRGLLPQKLPDWRPL